MAKKPKFPIDKKILKRGLLTTAILSAGSVAYKGNKTTKYNSSKLEYVNKIRKANEKENKAIAQMSYRKGLERSKMAEYDKNISPAFAKYASAAAFGKAFKNTRGALNKAGNKTGKKIGGFLSDWRKKNINKTFLRENQARHKELWNKTREKRMNELFTRNGGDSRIATSQGMVGLGTGLGALGLMSMLGKNSHDESVYDYDFEKDAFKIPTGVKNFFSKANTFTPGYRNAKSELAKKYNKQIMGKAKRNANENFIGEYNDFLNDKMKRGALWGLGIGGGLGLYSNAMRD